MIPFNSFNLNILMIIDINNINIDEDDQNQTDKYIKDNYNVILTDMYDKLVDKSDIKFHKFYNLHYTFCEH